MAIDPEILMAGANMADGNAPIGNSVPGLDELIKANPQFNKPQYELPPVGLNLDNLGVGNFDSQAYQAESNRMSPETKQEISDGVNDLLSAAESGDEEAGYNALAAAALGEDEDRSLEEMTTDYQEFTKLVEQGPAAIEEFVRQALAPDPDDKKESLPEWALPMTVFGLTLQSEPGDWRQAILRARAKTKQTMFKHKQGQKVAKAQVDAAIKEKALNIYTEFQKGKQLSAKEVVDIIGTGKVDPKSLETFMGSGKASDLKAISVPKDSNELLDKFTAASVGKFVESGGTDYNLLVRLPGKGDDPNLEYLKQFTPDSVQLYNEGGRKDTSVLVRKTGSTADKEIIKELIELSEKYTLESVDKFAVSRLFEHLVPKDAGNWTPDFGGDTAATQQNSIRMMQNAQFREDLRTTAKEAQKIEQLRNYSTLYAQTLEKKIMTTGDQVTVKGYVPFAGAMSPKAYASDIGLDPNTNKEVFQILDVAELSLPNASEEDLTAYQSLHSLKNKMTIIGTLLETAPENLTGVRGYMYNTDAARIASDLLPFDIPAETQLKAVWDNVAEVNLIKTILNEARFSDEDRKLVMRFIQGRNFKTTLEARLRHQEVMEVINRGLNSLNFKLESYKTPPRFTPETYTMSPDGASVPVDRTEQLRTNILELSNQPTN